tara:strand:- start:168 stop:1118 length:951 start_codon:yes stop_codon:yes gene_type:complete
MKKFVVFLIFIQCGTGGVEYEELSIIETTSTTTLTTTSSTTTSSTTTSSMTTTSTTTSSTTTTTVAPLIRNDFDIIDLPVPTLIRVNTHVKETSESPYWKNKSGDELTIVFRLDLNSETGWKLPYENEDGSIDLRNPSVQHVFIDFTYQADCYIQSGSNIRDYPHFFSQTDPSILRIDKSLDPPFTGSELNDFNCKTSNKIPIYTITIYISKTNPFNSFTDIDFGNVAYVRYYFGAHSSRDIEPSFSCSTEEFLSKNFPRVETHDWGVKGCRTVDTLNFPETNNPLGFDYSGTGNNGYQVEWNYKPNVPSFNLSDR